MRRTIRFKSREAGFMKNRNKIKFYIFLIGICLLFSCNNSLSNEPDVVNKSCGEAAPEAQFLTLSEFEPQKVLFGNASKKFMIHFNVSKKKNQNRLDSIIIKSQENSGWKQTLHLSEALLLDSDEEFFIGIEDINFDGFYDLYITIRRGVANTYNDYWLYNSNLQSLVYLGNYPYFKTDSDQCVLSTYERGGHGGRIFEQNFYRFKNDMLINFKKEKQEYVSNKDSYKKELYELKNEQLTLTKTKIVKYDQ
jgi:hypothetical protein